MKRLTGPWIRGYAFDVHTISSQYLGDNDYGRAMFDTKRSQIGQFVYDLKYGQHGEVLNQIADLLIGSDEFCRFINNIDIILPVPPSNKYRQIQPVQTISNILAQRMAIEINHDVLSSTNKDELKDVETEEKYDKIRASVNISSVIDRNLNILIFDDVYDSGSTLKAFTDILNENGYANVFVFTLTKTRISD